MRTQVFARRLWLLMLALLASLTGCNKAEEPAAPQNPGAVLQVEPNKTQQTTNPPRTEDLAKDTVLFKDAVLLEPPDGELRPPDKTAAGKNVAALFEEIAGKNGAPGLWDKVRLKTPDGKAIRYHAHVKTDLGTIEIELLSESAPNHVRSFIALAQAGYYNGLPFHRTLNQNVAGTKLEFLEAGCPLGTGEFGYGSVGYWLKPEIAPALVHQEGTVGAVHGDIAESAACKFYITLTRFTGMDGGYTIFGKITRGLDVAHTINKRPVVEEGELSDRPKEPVIIRAVTIHSSAASSNAAQQRSTEPAALARH